MRKYRRVTLEDRCQIFAWKQEIVSNGEISRRLGFNKSTISRELKRNKGLYSYAPNQAHNMALSRYRVCRKPYKIKGEKRSIIELKIKNGWSPEQISGRFKREQKMAVSHECIYQYLRKNKKYFKPYLRRFHKTGGSRNTEFTYKKYAELPKISDRPLIANERKRIGDWERDCMFTLNKKPLLIVTDRKSRYTKIGVPLNLFAATMNKETSRLLKETGRKVFTITNDRGPEFSQPLERIKTYYCDPYRPSQRGTIENTIGLLRQYIKNKTNIESMGMERIKEIETNLNLRPRKCLNYKTPFEVFFRTTVALAS